MKIPPPLILSCLLAAAVLFPSVCQGEPDELNLLEKQFDEALTELRTSIKHELGKLRRESGNGSPNYTTVREQIIKKQQTIEGDMQAQYQSLLQNLSKKYAAEGNTSARSAVETKLAAIRVAKIQGLFTPPIQTPATNNRVAPQGEAVTQTVPPTSAPAPKYWPNSTSVFTDFRIETIREDYEKEIYVYATPHFQFKSDAKLNPTVIRQFSEIFEATYNALEQLPLGLDLKPKEKGRFKTQLFSSFRRYFLAGGPPGSAGAYSPNLDLIIVPLESLGVKRSGKKFVKTDAKDQDNGTLIHEITHQVMRKWLGTLPIWYTEGIADYMAAAPYRNGIFSFGSPSRAVRDQLKSRYGIWGSFAMPKPANMFSISRKRWSQELTSGRGTANYASAGMLATYFHHKDGNGDASGIRAYIQAIGTGTHEPAARQEHLLRGRSEKQFQEDFSKFWKRQSLRLSYR